MKLSIHSSKVNHTSVICDQGLASHNSVSRSEFSKLYWRRKIREAATIEVRGIVHPIFPVYEP